MGVPRRPYRRHLIVRGKCKRTCFVNRISANDQSLHSSNLKSFHQNSTFPVAPPISLQSIFAVFRQFVSALKATQSKSCPQTFLGFPGCAKSLVSKTCVESSLLCKEPQQECGFESQCSKNEGDGAIATSRTFKRSSGALKWNWAGSRAVAKRYFSSESRASDVRSFPRPCSGRRLFRTFATGKQPMRRPRKHTDRDFGTNGNVFGGFTPVEGESKEFPVHAEESGQLSIFVLY
jgi:hypothetical protein